MLRSIHPENQNIGCSLKFSMRFCTEDPPLNFCHTRVQLRVGRGQFFGTRPRNPIPGKLPVNKRLPMSILQKFNSMLATEPHPPPTPRTNPTTNPTANKTGKQKLTKNSPIIKRRTDSKQKKLVNNKNKLGMSCAKLRAILIFSGLD